MVSRPGAQAPQCGCVSRSKISSSWVLHCGGPHFGLIHDIPLDSLFVVAFLTRENRAYKLQLEGGNISVYCHMDEIPGCRSGGFTMVMKIDGSKVT